MFDKWDHRFMEMAQLVSTWASCYQEERKVGAVIVKDKRVMTTGYNGAPAGLPPGALPCLCLPVSRPRLCVTTIAPAGLPLVR